MKYKVLEPVLLLGLPRFALVDIRVRVSGGGYVAQIYGEYNTYRGRAAVAASSGDTGGWRAATISGARALRCVVWQRQRADRSFMRRHLFAARPMCSPTQRCYSHASSGLPCAGAA